MKRLVIALVFSCALIGAAPAQAQPGGNVEIKTTEVAKNIYMLEGSGGNIGVSVGGDGILIIDDQYAPLAGRIRAALKELSDGKLQFVLNTHFHGDHTGGNAEFGKGASIIAHANVRKRLVSGSMAKEGLPTITFDESLSVHFNGQEIRLIHFPEGHTDSDCVVFFDDANVVHMGDHFFKDRFPFIDLTGGGSVEGYLRNLGHIIENLPADVKVIPGHGALATLDDLKRFRDTIDESVGIIRKKMEDGKSADEIKAEGLPEKWKDWGGGFINTNRWIDIVYTSISK